MVGCGLALASIDARAQPAQHAGSAEASTEPERGSDDEEASSGSAQVLTAPADPKTRTVWLSQHLATAIAAHAPLQHARVGVSVVDLTTGAELFTHEPDKGLNLASNTKLLTSVAALGTLGAGFRWRTAVYVD